MDRLLLRIVLIVMLILTLSCPACRGDHHFSKRPGKAPITAATPAAESAGPVVAPTCTLIEQDKYSLTKIGENVYVMSEFRNKQSNAPVKTISWVVTSEGVVVIDTGNPVTALMARHAIASLTKKPIKYIIYTHHHGSHVGGARQLKGPQTKVIAHEDLVLEFDLARELQPFRKRLNSIQFNFDERHDDKDPDLVYPDLTYSAEYSFELGGVRFELYHADAESRDYTYVVLPQQKIVWLADLVSAGAPMVASPMKPVRDDVKWRRALEAIRGLDPLVIVESVKPPICDRELIAELLEARIGYLDFLHQAVIAEINAGATVERAVHNISLPPELANNPLAWDEYGCLAFNVRGLFQQYAGWFDQNGTHLDLTPAEQRAASYVEAMGGGPAVLTRARTLLQRGEPQLALEYLDLLLDAGIETAPAHQLKNQALLRLAKKATHNITEQMYRRLAKLEQQAAEAKP